MDKASIIEQIKQMTGISEAEEIEYKPEYLVLRFYYEFDDDEIDAARDYADTESTGDDEDEWYDDYYIPFLVDMAVDEVRDTIEEMVESGNINAQYISYEPERDDKSLEFVAVFTDDGVEFDIDEVLNSLGI